jgi:cephalosporin hydroxylase
MKYEIDTDSKVLTVLKGADKQELPLYGKEAFELISDLWMKTGWNQKYSYTFSWMGRPVIQHPEDMLRLQEVIYDLAPDVIVETGVAHGGSLIYMASLFKAMGKKGKIIGVDIEIRPHNLKAIEEHDLFEYITLIVGDSAAPEIVSEVESHIKPDDKVLVILDSDHSKGHVTRELNAYHHLVTPGSYIVSTDGLMQDLHDVPRGEKNWDEDNPAAAARDFEKLHPEFEIRQPDWTFNESDLTKNITGWPDAWLLRK